MATIGDRLRQARTTTSEHTKGPQDVPNPKKPKSRPRGGPAPGGLREHFLRKTLPRYSGPYRVGVMEIEVPVREPRTVSNITRDHEPLLELKTVLLTVHYPCALESGEGPAPDGSNQWSRPTWLPRPRAQVAKGYGNFAQIHPWLTVAWLGTTSMLTKLPAYRNAKLATHWPLEQDSTTGGFQGKNAQGPRPDGEPEDPMFPLLMFIHGLGGTRNTYSSVIGEFASYGFVVCVVEHRDGSGPKTFVNLPPGTESAHYKGSEKNKRYDVKDHVIPKYNPWDSMPSNEQGVDEELRHAQLEMRLAEIEEAYHVMEILHSGAGQQIDDQNLRVKGNIGSSTRGLKGVDWASWKNRFHLDKVTVAGHSFGAATTVEVLRHTNRFSFVGQGIIYDIWGAVIKPPEQVSGENNISVPILGINSEAFMYWDENYDVVTSLCREAKARDALCWLMTVRGTVHLSLSDFALLYPRILTILFKMTSNPQRALDININASLEFLKTVMPDRLSCVRVKSEHLLEIPLTDKMPDERRPASKYRAQRLRVPNEVFSRTFLMHKRRKHINLPAWGKHELRDEIWMHVAPTNEELEKHSDMSGAE